VRRLLKVLDVKKHMENGLNILIFEQEGEVLRRSESDPWPRLTLQERKDRPELVSFGLRQERLSARNVFIRDPEHPVLKGLSNEDFADWRGASNLISPWTPEKWYRPVTGYSRSWREWNKSNLGDVATYIFEKPQGGNFISLLDTSFDLLYSALIEEKREKGKTIYCQLNVTNRYGVDPAATLVVDRILSYAAGKSEGPKGKAALLAGKQWRAVLSDMPFDIAQLDEKSDAQVLKGLSTLIVGLGAPYIDDYDESNKFIGASAAAAEKGKDTALTWLDAHKKEVEEFVAGGGTVLVLPVQKREELSWLPFKVELKKEKVFAVKPMQFFARCSTVGPADLYWRRAVEMPVLSALPKGSVTASPAVFARTPWQQGEFIFSQVHPRSFYGNWARAKIIRVISAVLTEKGVADRADLDLTTEGYQKGGFPYFGCTLYFDPFLSTSW